jgi:outer membrane scaffolding protein for murein synthesis (MipA/OmpV family)
LTASARAFRLCLALVLGAASPFSEASQPLWELGLGVGALSLPHYRGSDRTRQWLLPVPYGIYRGEVFRATREGARAVLLESDRLDFDLSAAASAPADSAGDPARRGMPDLEPTVEIGPNLNYTQAKGAGWQLDLRLPVRAVFTLGGHARGMGWTVSPALNLDLQLYGWSVGLQGGPMWGSRAYHAHFYDVPTAYATSERAAYQTSGGRSGWRATLGLSRRFSAVWAGAFVRADSVANAVFEASPLVRRRGSLSFGIAVSSVLLTSSTLVSDER